MLSPLSGALQFLETTLPCMLLPHHGRVQKGRTRCYRQDSLQSLCPWLRNCLMDVASSSPFCSLTWYQRIRQCMRPDKGEKEKSLNNWRLPNGQWSERINADMYQMGWFKIPGLWLIWYVHKENHIPSLGPSFLAHEARMPDLNLWDFCEAVW